MNMINEKEIVFDNDKIKTHDKYLYRLRCVEKKR